jgi:hypothetical protein
MLPPFLLRRNVLRNTQCHSSLALILLFVVVLAFVPTVALADYVTLPTFEATVPASYFAGQTLIGVDGWTSYAAGSAVVTPVAGGETRVLEGSQSAALYGDGGTVCIARNFDAGTTMDDNTIVAWEFIGGGTAGDTTMYLSHNLAGGKTPIGLNVNHDTGNFDLYGYNAPAASASGTFVAGDKYLLEVALNFTTDTFEGFYTNLTAAGTRTSLGTAGFAGGTPLDLTGAQLAAGAIAPWSDASGVGAVAIFDNATIPEPSAITLLALGLISLLAYAWRKQK